VEEDVTKPGLRDVRLWTPQVESLERPDGSILVWRGDPLGPYPDRITERLVHWARHAPDRTWIAQRSAQGDWRHVAYGEALLVIRRIAQALLDLRLSAERPLLILSENSIEHALIALAAQHVGVTSAAVSTAFSLVSTDYTNLRNVAAQVTPGLVYAADGNRYRAAIEAIFAPDVTIAVSADPIPGRRCLTFADLTGTEPTEAVDRAHAAVGGDTIAKFLFTSGTTGSPKAVIQTHRMLCSNQAMIADCYAFMRDEPPVVVDWAPWSHTASGNKVFYMVLYNGGAYYIDGGKPSRAGMAETICNLRDVSPTWYFNVPAGFELLIEAMERDAELRQSFFRQLKVLLNAGAGMAQHTWDRLLELAVETTGSRVLMTTGLGATETAPFALMCTIEQERAGNVGVPAQGVTLKLVPNQGKLEARLKGPSITPGYWRDPQLTQAAFDEEGFYKLGDALRFAVPGDPAQGFFFDGRLAENFKLDTGTWVAVGALRARLVNELGGLVRDAVIAGENRHELGALLVPFWPALRALVQGEPALSDKEILTHPAVSARLAEHLSAHAAKATGSASRVVRAMLMEDEPSFDKGEITEKGSVNQRAVLRHRASLVDALYADDDGRVVRAKTGELVE
jgi:feruloyl-CoA synthase